MKKKIVVLLMFICLLILAGCSGLEHKVLLSYNERDYLDESGGMKQNGDWYDMKLKVTGQYAMLVRERVYGKNQQVECVDNNTTILSCKMQNKENIKVFVLGFGSHCEVLEPEWLKDDMLGIAKTLRWLSKRTPFLAPPFHCHL